MELSRRDIRVMIWYDWKTNVSAQECHNRLQLVAGDRAPSKSSVHHWYRELQQGRTSLGDEPRGGRPATAVTPANIDAVRILLTENRRITYNDIQATLDIGTTAVKTILHEHIGVRKYYSRWIPDDLTADVKKARIDWCKKMIRKFDHGRSTSVHDIIIGDELCIYHESKPKGRSKRCFKQMIATFFCRTDHIATIVPPMQSTAVNAEWYTAICLPEVLRKSREHRPRSKIILHCDIANAHNRITEYLAQEDVELLDPPIHSPDLSPCDFFLFPRIKGKMGAVRIDGADVAVEAYEKLISEIVPELWAECIDDWFVRMEKCINLNGEHLEEQ